MIVQNKPSHYFFSIPFFLLMSTNTNCRAMIEEDSNAKDFYSSSITVHHKDSSNYEDINRRDDITTRIKKIITIHLGVEEDKITESANFVYDLGADSLDTIELVMAFEEEFDCIIPDNVTAKIRTVKNAIDYISEHVAKAKNNSFVVPLTTSTAQKTVKKEQDSAKHIEKGHVEFDPDGYGCSEESGGHDGWDDFS